MNKRLHRFLLSCIFFLLILLGIYLIRAFSEKELDDINPNIQCDEELLKKADIFWIIPLYENKSIADNKEWCDYILSFNKKIELHGVYHEFNEFAIQRDAEYLSRGMNEFEKCFGFKPTMFKAPQMKINWQNKELLKQVGLKYRGKISQIFHKTYHCSDTGFISNNFNDLF